MDLKQESKKGTYASKEAEGPQVAKDDGGNKPTSSKRKIWLWIVILLILAIIVYFAVRSCVSPMPTDEGESSSDVPEEVIHDEAGTEETIVTDAESNRDTQEETLPVSEIEESSNAGSDNTVNNQTKDNSFSDVDKTAIKVIRGDYGNGQERKDKLGTAYASVQRRVNEMYRQGIFKR